VALPLSTRWVDPAGRAGLQDAMSRHAGIGRDAAGLASARQIAETVLSSSAPLGRAAVEATNLAQSSAVLLAAADHRTRSIGCHVRTDQLEAVATEPFSHAVRWTDGPQLADRLPDPVGELVR
jgi:aspartate oxidase